MKSSITPAVLSGTDPTAQNPSQPTKLQHPDQVLLRLLATSDLHANIMPYDYYSGTATNRLGLVRTASLIAAARAEVENCLLFDNGDFLHGSPLGDYIAQSRGVTDDHIHPMMAAMNHLAYDAATLGNHEFNYGLDFLSKSLAAASFPIVAANIYHDEGTLAVGKTFVPPYVILNRLVVDRLGQKHPIKIGVIGFTPPQIMHWDYHHVVGKLTTRDIVESAKIHVPKMQRDGADLIIALSHSGIGPSHAPPGLENVSTALAQVAGIDAVIAGHVHLVFPSDDFAQTADVDPVLGTLCGKPAVMPGFYGSHLGIIDLVLRHDGKAYKVHRHKSQVRPICHRAIDGAETALVNCDKGLTNLITPAHLATLDWANQPIGHTDLPLHSFFALLTETPALQLVAAAQALHVENTLASTQFANLPILTAIAPFKAGGRGGPENYTDVPVGDVMLRNAADLYIFPNASAALRMTGAEIADWLEFAVGIFNQILPESRDVALINPDFPSFNFDMIFGLQFQIDLSQPPKFDTRGCRVHPQSQRIVDLRYHGAPLDPSAVFAVATNSYRIAAKGGFLRPDDSNILFQSPASILDVVLRYFSDIPTLGFGTTKNRQFLAMPGTTVTFETSPKALAHLADQAPMLMEPIGLLPNGFMRFRLHL